MSWFTDIAGKAENFLNKIDQNAAVALNTNPTSKSDKETVRPRKTEPFLEPNEGNRSNFSSPPSNESNSNQTSESKILNGATTTFSSNNKNDSRKNNQSKKQQPHQNKVGISANTAPSTASNSYFTTKASKASSQGSANASGKLTNEKARSNLKGNSKNSTANPNNEEELIAYLNSSELTELNESLILKDEVESQARELKLLTNNHRSLQKEHEELKKKLDIYRDKLASLESNKSVNEVEEQSLRKLLEDKNEEIRSLSSRHEQALETLQKLELSQDSLLKLEHCLLENSQLKSENENNVQRAEMLAQQVETAENHVLSMKSTLSSMEKEFSNYKDKAKSILNYKDELIASLKSNGCTTPNVDYNANTAEELLAEVTALKNERELLQADLSQNRAVVESLKDDNIRLEKEISSLRYYSEDLNNHLKKEKETVGSLQSENLQICQQLTSLQFDLEREKNDRKKSEEIANQYKKNIQSGLSEHSREPSNSQNGYLSSGNSTISNEREIQKLKTRINALSQSLLEKQSLINDISTDKQLLQIEVERLKNDLRDCKAESDEYCHVSSLPQTVIASQPLYLSESPWDSRVSARMKRIYTQLDAVFCQFGIALRKRPNLRLGMSLYVIFLHLWVFFVLFSWMHHTVPE